MKNEAYVNHGRWLANCPKCGTPNLIKPGDLTFICLVCYPELLAVAYRPKKNDPALFVKVPDEEERAAARRRAHKNREEHRVTYKEKPADVDKILLRRKPVNRHWTTESLDQLRGENREHGVK